MSISDWERERERERERQRKIERQGDKRETDKERDRKRERQRERKREREKEKEREREPESDRERERQRERKRERERERETDWLRLAVYYSTYYSIRVQQAQQDQQYTFNSILMPGKSYCKPLTTFSNHSSKASGLQTVCPTCSRIRHRDFLKKNNSFFAHGSLWILVLKLYNISSGNLKVCSLNIIHDTFCKIQVNLK